MRPNLKPVAFVRYVILPRCRSSAEALHLMFTHAIGEAGSPYLIGVIADVRIFTLCDIYVGICRFCFCFICISF